MDFAGAQSGLRFHEHPSVNNPTNHRSPLPIPVRGTRLALTLDRVATLGYLRVVWVRAVDGATTACFAGKPSPCLPFMWGR